MRYEFIHYSFSVNGQSSEYKQHLGFDKKKLVRFGRKKAYEIFCYFFLLFSNLSKTKKNNRLKDFFQSQQRTFFQNILELTLD